MNPFVGRNAEGEDPLYVPIGGPAAKLGPGRRCRGIYDFLAGLKEK